MKIVTFIAIRPDIVRLSKVINKLDSDPKIEHILVHSGQHFEDNLSQVFFKDLGVRDPDFNLEVGGHGVEHYQQQSLLCIRAVELMRKIKPDLIVFLGDSGTVMVAPILKRDRFKIAHVESGMRSFDETMPEEINRIAIDHVSDLLLVYHKNYAMKLILENISRERIKVIGNTIVETALEMKKQLRLPGTKSHILVDIHRQENHSSKERLYKILEFVAELGLKLGKPVKMLEFGRTKSAVKGFELETPKNVEWVPLMGYKDFCQAQVDSYCVVSDSGTQTEEGPLFNVPVLVPRNFTERPESYDAGCSLQTNLKYTAEQNVKEAIEFIKDYHKNGCDISWLGDGKTSEHIVREIKKFLGI